MFYVVVFVGFDVLVVYVLLVVDCIWIVFGVLVIEDGCGDVMCGEEV